MIINSDCLSYLQTMPDSSVDSIVTDPPYGLSNTSPDKVTEAIRRWVSGDREYIPSGRGFMGKAWDSFVPPVAVWDECLRVLKPGGHMLVFAGSRTQDLMGLAIRLSGFDIRDSLSWLYGSGFPKSLDVSKAIDKAAGAEREVVGKADRKSGPGRHMTALAGGYGESVTPDITAPATPDAARWQGWGTALKPGHEPIILARKPFPGTVAANVLDHGTGALNIDGCRVGDESTIRTQRGTTKAWEGGAFSGDRVNGSPAGRWPANVVLDEDQADVLDGQSPNASRFFYCAKAGKKERPEVNGVKHSTVKPLRLMRWLVRLITPPGGVVLDPFAGSGTTAEACILEGFDYIVVENEAEYIPLIDQRVSRAMQEQGEYNEVP